MDKPPLQRRERTYFESLTVKVPTRYEEVVKESIENNAKLKALIEKAAERFKALLEKGKE